MGIKGLKQFLRSKFPSIFRPTHIYHWFGKKVALDLLPYLYRYKTTFGETWKIGLAGLLSTFIKERVHVTVIMDGPGVYKDKDKERTKRKEQRDKIQTKREDLQHDLDQYRLNRTITPLLESISNEHSSHRRLLLQDSTPTIDEAVIQAYIEKLEKQVVSITPEDIATVESLCVALHIPFLIAEQEAESYGSYLCRNGFVDAVVTEDTDVLAYGCPVWISGIAHDGTCVEIRMSEVYETMEWNESLFLDFCILCGTDYNESLPKIGPVSAYKGITTHRSLETFVASLTVDASCLHSDRLREIFTHPCSNAIVSREDKTVIPVRFTFNDQPNQESLQQLRKDNYPTQWLVQFIQSYSSYIIFE
jgi:5'-3' exonuclease